MSKKQCSICGTFNTCVECEPICPGCGDIMYKEKGRCEI